MFREGTSKQLSDSHTEQEQRSKKSSYENESSKLEELRGSHQRFQRLSSDGASSSSNTNPMDTSELGLSQHEDQSLPHVQDGQLLASELIQLHELPPQSEPLVEHHPQLEQQSQEQQDQRWLCLPLDQFFQQWQQKLQQGWQEFMPPASPKFQRRLRQPVWAVEYALSELRLLQESGLRSYLRQRLYGLIQEPMIEATVNRTVSSQHFGENSSASPRHDTFVPDLPMDQFRIFEMTHRVNRMNMYYGLWL
jgi:hypothetical protein